MSDTTITFERDGKTHTAIIGDPAVPVALGKEAF